MSLAMRTAAAMLVLLFAGPLIPGSASANCKKAMKALNALGKAERSSRDGLSSARKASKAADSAGRHRATLMANLSSCDWPSRLSSVPALRPYIAEARAAGAGTPEYKALTESWVTLEVGIRSMLPDDPICHIAARKAGGSKGMRKCFSGQSKGATQANLKRIAKGLCMTRKGGSAAQKGKEMNTVAKLFETHGLPGQFVESLVDGMAQVHCPKVLDR